MSEKYFSIRTGARTAEYAEFFRSPLSDLAGNQSMHASTSLADLIEADGGRLTFTGEVLDYLRGHRADHEDGSVTDDSSGTRVWIQGEGYLVEAAS